MFPDVLLLFSNVPVILSFVPLKSGTVISVSKKKTTLTSHAFQDELRLSRVLDDRNQKLRRAIHEYVIPQKWIERPNWT